MTRTDYIRHAFSDKQMEILAQLAIDEMCRQNKQGQKLNEDLEHAYELLKVARNKYSENSFDFSRQA